MQLVQLSLGGCLLPTLGVLDGEHHHQGEGGHGDLEGHHPLVGKPEHAADDQEDHQEQHPGDGHRRHRAVVVDAVEHLADQRQLGGAPRDVPARRRCLVRFTVSICREATGRVRRGRPARTAAHTSGTSLRCPCAVPAQPVDPRSDPVIHDPRRALPAGWVEATARGFGPFITEVTMEGRDGRRAVWSSRHHRKRSTSPDGSTWWAPRALGWWMAVLFAIGSACFAGAAIPTLADHIGSVADNSIYFVGSIFFTTAGLLQYGQVVGADDPTLSGAGARLRRLATWSPHRIDWLAAAVQSVGTVFFNISTAHALEHRGHHHPGPEPRHLATRRPRVHLLPRLQLPLVRRGVPRILAVDAPGPLLVDHRGQPGRIGGLRRVGGRLPVRGPRPDPQHSTGPRSAPSSAACASSVPRSCSFPNAPRRPGRTNLRPPKSCPQRPPVAEPIRSDRAELHVP